MFICSQISWVRVAKLKKKKKLAIKSVWWVQECWHHFVQISLKTAHKVVEGGLDSLGKELLTPDTDLANVAVVFKHVQDLGTVGHPKCHHWWIIVVPLKMAKGNNYVQLVR